MEPKLINTDTKKQAEILAAYESLCTELSIIKLQLSEHFGELSLKELFEFTKSKDPKRWLSIKYAEIRQNEFPAGSDVAKMVGLGFLAMPHELQECISDHDHLSQAMDKVRQSQFYTPLASLYSEPEGTFQLNDEFREAVHRFCSTYTETPEQTQILETFETLRDLLNKLHAKGIYNFFKNGINSIGQLANHFDLDKSSKEAPLIVSRHCFRALGKHRIDFRVSSPHNFNEVFRLNGSVPEPEAEASQEPEQEPKPRKRGRPRKYPVEA